MQIHAYAGDAIHILPIVSHNFTDIHIGGDNMPAAMRQPKAGKKKSGC